MPKRTTSPPDGANQATAKKDPPELNFPMRLVLSRAMKHRMTQRELTEAVNRLLPENMRVSSEYVRRLEGTGQPVLRPDKASPAVMAAVCVVVDQSPEWLCPEALPNMAATMGLLRRVITDEQALRCTTARDLPLAPILRTVVDFRPVDAGTPPRRTPHPRRP